MEKLHFNVRKINQFPGKYRGVFWFFENNEQYSSN
jgi:hypothetical protein